MIGKRVWLMSLVLLLAAATVLSACSKDGGKKAADNGQKAGEENKEQVKEETKSADTKSDGTKQADTAPKNEDGPLGKYDPPIEVTTIRQFNSGLEFLKGESWDNNVYQNGLKDDLGIQMKNLWIVDDQQYPRKLNVTLVSGNIPDVFEVNMQQLQLLVEAGQIADLTDVYEKYASELTRKSMDEVDGINKKAATFNGRLMAIGSGGGGRDDAQMIYIRTDWLEKLKLQPPKTMDDVIQIAKAFANDDPDGNGKKDTFGLNLDYNLFNGWAGLDGFFNGFHAYPFNPGGTGSTGLKLVFVKKGDQLDYADIQPEVKTALGKLQELFKAGAINPEFSVMNGEKSAELAKAGKVGMTFGQFWNPSWPLSEMKSKDPKVDWGVYPLVSVDDKPVLALGNGVVPQKYYVVSKKAKHPEAAIKILNYYMEKNYGETRDEKFHSVKQGDKDIGTFGLSPLWAGFADTNQDDFYSVQEALKSKDPSKLNPTARRYYDGIMDYREGKLLSWANEKMFGSEDASSYGILGTYKKNNQYLINAFLGSPTDTMVKNGPALRDLEVKTFTKIIMNEEPLDAFDKFVQDWMDQGGKQILQEVNEWYSQHK